ncbi:QsdR family transcriptional regulator [Rhodococcus oryzae]|uniref:QsdR family transcriptional regulator n=1 Tax=Rhodococcus oryzae TaxID=2571143 RepID=UPI0037B68FC3
MSPQDREGGPPTFRRPTAGDAIQVAVWLFQHGERVDMNTVATHLDIGRSTLYRWVGDREKLMDRVILASIGDIWERALAAATGEGLEHPLDASRRFMEGCIEYRPLTQFAQREPNLALRVLLDPDGLVTRALQRSLANETASAAPENTAPTETFGVLALTATALVWANVAADRRPDIEATVGIMRTVLAAHMR